MKKILTLIVVGYFFLLLISNFNQTSAQYGPTNTPTPTPVCPTIVSAGPATAAAGSTVNFTITFSHLSGTAYIDRGYFGLTSTCSVNPGASGCGNFERQLAKSLIVWANTTGSAGGVGTIGTGAACSGDSGDGCPWTYFPTNPLPINNADGTATINSVTVTNNGNSKTYTWNVTLGESFPAGTYNYYAMVRDTGLHWQNCGGAQWDKLTTVDVTAAVPTPTPGSWYKLKNASLYKNSEVSLSLPASISAFDADDDGTRNLVIGSPGVVTSTGAINFYSTNPFKSNANDWQNANYSFSSQSLIGNFYDYVKSRKDYEEITSVGNVVENKINIIKTDSLSLGNDAFSATPPFVLVVRNAADTGYGDLVVTENIDNSNTNVVIVAKSVTFESPVTSAYGIFIADSVNVQGTTNGLKIVGNLISNTAMTIPDRTDSTKPSVFVLVDPNQYISLLPLISTSKYDFQQTQ